MKRKTFLIPSTLAVSQFLGARVERKQAIRSDRNFKQSRSSLIIEGVVRAESRGSGELRGSYGGAGVCEVREKQSKSAILPLFPTLITS